MFWRVRGFGRKGVAFCAISSIDIALWDLKAKAFGVPLYRLLGPYTDTVPIYGSGGWTSFSEDELVKEQTGYVERGIPRVKMKVAKDFGKSEAEDLKRLAAVRKAVGDDVEIFVDANNGYYAKQAIAMAQPLRGVQRPLVRGAGPGRRHRRAWPRSRARPPSRSPPASTSTPSTASRS